MLTDLGVARVLGETAAGEVTPAYVDPTVARGGAPGPASDVFGVAAAAFHALTGIAPWNAATPADTLAVAAAGYLPDLAELAPGGPAGADRRHRPGARRPIRTTGVRGGLRAGPPARLPARAGAAARSRGARRGPGPRPGGVPDRAHPPGARPAAPAGAGRRRRRGRDAGRRRRRPARLADAASAAAAAALLAAVARRGAGRGRASPGARPGRPTPAGVAAGDVGRRPVAGPGGRGTARRRPRRTRRHRRTPAPADWGAVRRGALRARAEAFAAGSAATCWTASTPPAARCWPPTEEHVAGARRRAGRHCAGFAPEVRGGAGRPSTATRASCDLVDRWPAYEVVAADDRTGRPCAPARAARDRRAHGAGPDRGRLADRERRLRAWA